MGGGMSKDLTAPEKKPAGGPLFVCTVTILPRLFSQEEQVKRAIGKPRSQLMDRPPGKAQEPPRKQGSRLAAKGTQAFAPGRCS